MAITGLIKRVHCSGKFFDLLLVLVVKHVCNWMGLVREPLPDHVLVINPPPLPLCDHVLFTL